MTTRARLDKVRARCRVDTSTYLQTSPERLPCTRHSSQEVKNETQSVPREQGSSPVQIRSPCAGSQVSPVDTPPSSLSSYEARSCFRCCPFQKPLRSHTAKQDSFSSHTAQATADMGLETVEGQRDSSPARPALLGRPPRESTTTGRNPSEWTE